MSFSSGDQVIETSVRQVTDNNDWVPKEIQRFLEEYKEIVSEDILDGLPHVRSINHCMGLIPRASFPNKEPYRLTLREN